MPTFDDCRYRELAPSNGTLSVVCSTGCSRASSSRSLQPSGSKIRNRIRLTEQNCSGTKAGRAAILRPIALEEESRKMRQKTDIPRSDIQGGGARSQFQCFYRGENWCIYDGSRLVASRGQPPSAARSTKVNYPIRGTRLTVKSPPLHFLFKFWTWSLRCQSFRPEVSCGLCKPMLDGSVSGQCASVGGLGGPSPRSDLDRYDLDLERCNQCLPFR